MYIPSKSGHTSHTTKNYVLGEIKRHRRYNSLKLSFLKIRTHFFSRLRNRGFKKLWLRRIFSVLKYEDRQKLMEDSHFSDPESQVVAETEAEGLMVRDLEQILEETPGIRAKIAPVFRPDLPGAKPLSAAGPPIILGGTLSGHPFFNVQVNGSLYSQESTTVNQGSRKTAAATTLAAATAQTTEKAMEEIPLRRKRKSSTPAAENNSMYLILPSYAEKHKITIKQIIAKEKEKLCKDSYFNNIFSSVNFNIAFTNDRSVKNLIVRTKI
jgi:hypothetical protein